MVLTMIVMIAIMVVDRYLYSSQSFEQKQTLSNIGKEEEEFAQTNAETAAAEAEEADGQKVASQI